MKLNTNHTIAYCNTRNELINAIKTKAVVVEIDGALKRDMDKELKKQLKIQKKVSPIKNLGKSVGVISTVSAAMALISPVIGGATLLSSLAFAVGGTAVAGITGAVGDSEFKKYNFAIFENHVLLIHNIFQPEYDSIKGYSYKFILSNENKCPNCDKIIKGLETSKKMGKNPCECPNCKQKYVWTLSPQKYSKKS